MLKNIVTNELIITLLKKVLSYESLPWLTGFLSHKDISGETFTETNPPESRTELRQTGPWLFLTINLLYEGVTDGPTTDRAAGDPYLANVRYDWIGPAISAPESVTDPKELDAWSVLKTFYVREYNDVGIWGGHEGSWIESIDKDGTVTIRDASGRFHDELPETKMTARTVRLQILDDLQ